MTLTVSDLHHLAAVAIAEPTCSRPSCDCTGPLAELHAKVDAHCARSLADSIERARDCERDGHRFSWLDRSACLHCGAIA